MGTSSSYNGPTGNPPLLPPWATDPLLPPLLLPEDPPPVTPPLPLPPDQQTSPIPDSVSPQIITPGITPNGTWRAPKIAIGRFARGGGMSAAGSALRSYVRAHGGARQAAATAVAGRAATGRLGRFLADTAQRGIVQAANRLGLTNLVGRDAQLVLAAFIDLLLPPGALREQAVSRQAGIETLEALFER